MAHVELPNDEDFVCILTTKSVLLVKVNRLATVWQVSLADLKSISLEANGIMMTLRGDKPGPFIALSDSSLRIWFFSHIKRCVVCRLPSKVTSGLPSSDAVSSTSTTTEGTKAPVEESQSKQL